MTPALLVAALAALLALGATWGPRLLDWLAPALSARPRRGIAVWASATVAWVAGLLSLGPLLAWLVTGRTLPGPAGELCRRCLVAANPFATAPRWAGELPTYLLVLVAAILGIALVVSAVARLVVHRRRLRRRLRALAAVAERRRVHGTDVWVVPSAEPTAYALARRRDGIVVSRATVENLGADELAAVLAHEKAHVREHHHLVIGVAHVLATAFARVPLLAAAPAAVATYAEMAADDAARRTCGTPALAGALLALHRPTGSDHAPTTALHAARHRPLSRVERLVAGPPPPSRAGLTAVGGYALATSGAAFLVIASYAWAAATGC